jgi:hypothetical protein
LQHRGSHPRRCQLRWYVSRQCPGDDELAQRDEEEPVRRPKCTIRARSTLAANLLVHSPSASRGVRAMRWPFQHSVQAAKHTVSTEATRRIVERHEERRRRDSTPQPDGKSPLCSLSSLDCSLFSLPFTFSPSSEFMSRCSISQLGLGGAQGGGKEQVFTSHRGGMQHGDFARPLRPAVTTPAIPAA